MTADQDSGRRTNHKLVQEFLQADNATARKIEWQIQSALWASGINPKEMDNPIIEFQRLAEDSDWDAW